MKAWMFINSDFGKGSTIGARALPIAKKFLNKNNKLTIFCRDYKKGLETEFDLESSGIFHKLFMKFIVGLGVYFVKSIPSHEIQTRAFQRHLKRKINLKEKIDLVHSWEFIPEIYDIIKKNSPDTIIIHDVAAALPNVLNDLKSRKEFWNKDKFKSPDYLVYALKKADIIIVPSEFVKKSLLMEKIPEKKMFLVPFGVDIKKFKPRKKGNTLRYAFVGSVNNRKGIKYLVEAWKELNLKNTELHLYGRVYPETRKHLKDAKKYNIHIHGFVDIQTELPKNHVYVFPSLREGSSKSLYEAMACGLPVITTFNSGPIARDGKEGFIIPVEDKNALKKKIKFFYDNPGEIQKFGKRARKLAEKYTWEIYADNIMKVYSKVKNIK